ncbi:L-2,4-diaminobutyric acid acetyltransferase OS=Streptomyces microflavus OX=1919 GN=ectA_1 PE=3 SV=1 [Streptomyces microflavus]
MEDGAAIWRIARDSEVLDLNSSYSYLLWCRDFAATSAVARGEDGEPIAFVTGYIRPEPRPRPSSSGRWPSTRRIGARDWPPPCWTR